MASFPLTLRPAKTSSKMVVELDANRLERLADVLGLYNPAFLKSLDRAEADVKAGRVKKLRSLKDLA